MQTSCTEKSLHGVQSGRAPLCTSFSTPVIRGPGVIRRGTVKQVHTPLHARHIRALRRSGLWSSHDEPSNTNADGMLSSCDLSLGTRQSGRHVHNGDSMSPASRNMNAGELLSHLWDRYPLLLVVPSRTLEEHAFRAEPGSEEGSQASSLSPYAQTMQAPSVLLNSSLTMASSSQNSEGLGPLPPSEGLNASVYVGSSVDEKNTLRSFIWGGCRPVFLRAVSWRLLCGFSPSVVRQRNELRRKRNEYARYIQNYCTMNIANFYQPSWAAAASEQSGPVRSDATPAISQSRGLREVAEGRKGLSTASSQLPPHERVILTQIALDLPRHKTSIFHCIRTATSLARVLFLWAKRHPAVGYVQGMDDIVATFYYVFLMDAIRQSRATRGGNATEMETETSYLGGPCFSAAEDAVGEGSILRRLAAMDQAQSKEGWDHLTMEEMEQELKVLPPSHLLQVEADTYWCVGQLLSWLQDNFTQGQPGLVRAMKRLEDILNVADRRLMEFLDSSELCMMDLCFQWMHCLLAREMPLPLLLRLWDTYLAIGGEQLLDFHVCVCAALLILLGDKLHGGSMDTIMIMVKDPVGSLFTSSALSTTLQEEQSKWLDLLIAEAYQLWVLHFHSPA